MRPMSTMSIPIPAITARSRRVDQVGHLAYRLAQADEYRPGDDAVPDIELLDLGQGEDRHDVPKVEPVAGEHLEPCGPPVGARRADLLELRRVTAGLKCGAIRSRVDLDGLGPQPAC